MLTTMLLAIGIAVVLVRLYSLLRSVVWIQRRGVEFKAEIDKISAHVDFNLDPFAPIYDRTGGQFFPFGVRSYRLHRAAKRLMREKKRVRGALVWLLRRVWILYLLSQFLRSS